MPRTLLSLLAAVGLSLLVAGGAWAARVDLSPNAWPAGDLEHYSQLQLTWGNPKPQAVTSEGLVIGTTGALAVRSGVEALRQGGTAVDAALTASLAQITLNAGATVSFAGRMALVYYEAATGETYYLNGAWGVPSGESSGADIPVCGTPSGRQVLVHGFMSALEQAHDRFGVLPFKSLFGPSIYFAREGFEVNRALGSWIEIRAEVLTRYAGGRRIFLKPDATLYRQGDWFKQPRLARTLKRVSRKGSRYMYRGRWARKLVAAVRDQGGRMTLADLRSYEPLWLEPEIVEWNGLELHAPRYPGYGGVLLRASLTGLDASRLASAGHYSESIEALSELLEAVDRYHRVPVGPGSHSDGVVVIDSAGNVAAVLHTINTLIWGETGIFVDGISIADPGCWSQIGVTVAGPGGHVPNLETSFIVTRDGVPVAATSAVGSGLFEATLFSLANIFAYEMEPEETIRTPTFHLSSRTRDGTVIHRAVAGEFQRDLLDAARARGFRIDELPRQDVPLGWCVMATIDPRSGERVGAASIDWNGLAMGE
jgi:gamma-glutamyltranspeptidase/glutathione hydrolase